VVRSYGCDCRDALFNRSPNPVIETGAYATRACWTAGFSVVASKSRASQSLTIRSSVFVDTWRLVPRQRTEPSIALGLRPAYHTSQGIRPSGEGSVNVYLRSLHAFRLTMTDSKDKGFGSASPESVCPHCRAEGFVRVSPFVLRTGRHLHWHWHLLSPRLG